MSSLYETLVLFVPEITESELSEIQSSFAKGVQQGNGKMVSWEKWGKYLLAYPVEKHEYGIYALARFEIPAENKKATLDVVDKLLKVKFNTLVMRHLTSVLDKSMGLEYTKPLALDETPKNVTDILKENNMEGLISEKTREYSVEND